MHWTLVNADFTFYISKGLTNFRLEDYHGEKYLTKAPHLNSPNKNDPPVQPGVCFENQFFNFVLLLSLFSIRLSMRIDTRRNSCPARAEPF